jgi:hypothetical protein
MQEGLKMTIRERVKGCQTNRDQQRLVAIVLIRINGNIRE